MDVTSITAKLSQNLPYIIVIFSQMLSVSSNLNRPLGWVRGLGIAVSLWKIHPCILGDILSPKSLKPQYPTHEPSLRACLS